MSLFICAKCGCIENTATSNYWALTRKGAKDDHIYDESHTSKCSSYDLEEVCHHDNYVGKRVKRGLFKTKEGILLNADINGSYNIMRKVKGDAVMPPHTGFGYNPVKKFIN